MTMDWQLRKHPVLGKPTGPVVLAILDGVGIGPKDDANAIHLARTPNLDRLLANDDRTTLLRAHGKAVGLPSDKDMGNSEVGHNALGAGKIYDQGALLVNNAIQSGTIANGTTWKHIVHRCRKHDSALHFVGLLSDGNVHSNIEHLFSLLRLAKSEGIGKLYVHILLDGRDVPPHSALPYVEQLEQVLQSVRSTNCIARIASGGGRMTTTMDRYQADWSIVERGYQAHVLGNGPRFSTAQEAIKTFRSQTPGIIDQDLPAFVIVQDGKPIGSMKSGDCVINCNFRGDRAIQFSQAMEDPDFRAFPRQDHPDILYAGMMQYDGDTLTPKHYLVTPPHIEETMGEYLVHNGLRQLAISETQKYGHVTYFWNGNCSGYLDSTLEKYIEIPSDRVVFSERPWMKAAEITTTIIKELRTNTYDFVRVNYANGDMVGHTGDLEATICAMQVVDLQIGRLWKEVNSMGGILVVTADHGNADEMRQRDSSGTWVTDKTGKFVPRTSHTLSPVPFTIAGTLPDTMYRLKDKLLPSEAPPGIANVAATCLELMGYSAPPNFTPSLMYIP